MSDEPSRATQIDPTSRFSELQHALDDLTAARADINEATERLGRAKDRLDHAMLLYGLALLATEQPVPMQLVRELYWRHPDVRAAGIARAFGMSHGGQVHERVGNADQELPCLEGCGCTTWITVSNRADFLATQRRLRWRCEACNGCRAAALAEQARKEEEERESQRLREEWKREEERLAAMVRNREPASYYVEYSGVPGTFEMVDGEPRPR